MVLFKDVFGKHKIEFVDDFKTFFGSKSSLLTILKLFLVAKFMARGGVLRKVGLKLMLAPR